MPILTKPTTINKNQPATVTLDKAELAAVTTVAADAYWSDTSNWMGVVIVYKNDKGQKETLNFDATQEFPSATFLISAKARTDFKFQSITIIDFDNALFRVKRSVLTANATDSAFDVELPSGPVILGDFTQGVQPANWTHNEGVTFDQGYASFTHGIGLATKYNGSSILVEGSSYKIRVHIHSSTATGGSTQAAIFFGAGSESMTPAIVDANVGGYADFDLVYSDINQNQWEFFMRAYQGTLNISKIEIFAL